MRKACERKVNGAADACREQGIVFLLLAVETLGGLHKTAVQQMKRLAAALAGHTGQEESLNLMRGNAGMMTTRSPVDDFPQAQVDGVA